MLPLRLPLHYATSSYGSPSLLPPPARPLPHLLMLRRLPPLRTHLLRDADLAPPISLILKSPLNPNLKSFSNHPNQHLPTPIPHHPIRPLPIPILLHNPALPRPQKTHRMRRPRHCSHPHHGKRPNQPRIVPINLGAEFPSRRGMYGCC